MLLTGPIMAQAPEDPLEAYLKEKQPLDLDAYLREKRVSDLAGKTGTGQALGRGALQGASAGWGDEGSGLGVTAQTALQEHPELFGNPEGPQFALGHASPEAKAQGQSMRNSEREANEAASRSHPMAYLGGELAGGTVPTAAATVLTGGSALPAAVAQGMAQGAGYSNANTAGGLLSDTAVGGGVGAAGHTLGEVLGGGLRKLANLAKSKSSAAAGRAATQATEEANDQVAGLGRSYGGEVQKGSRYVENMMRLYEKMTPAQQALYGQLEKSGVIPNLQQQVAQSTLEAMPHQAATIAERKAALEAAQQALPQTIAARTAELSKPQFGADALSLAKSYGEPVLAAALAPPGMKEAAGLIFGRTRAGKAIATRVNRPGNQIALWNAVQGTAEAPLAGGGIGQFLRQAIQAAAAQRSIGQLVTQ